MHNPLVALLRALSLPVLSMWLFLLADAASSAEASVDNAYQQYVSGQLAKTDAIAAHGQSKVQFVSMAQIETLAKLMQSRITVVNNFALCHGTRSGRENVWFRQAWPGMQVWGTELSTVAAANAPWTTPWDFHRQRPEWVGQADFVYTNALDHSFNATLAISQWITQTQPKGAVVIQWGDSYTKNIVWSKHGKKSTTDLFEASEAAMVDLICGLRTQHGPLSLHKLPVPWSSTANKPAQTKNWAYVIMRAPRGASERAGSDADLCSGS